jgi:hypothetical protein
VVAHWPEGYVILRPVCDGHTRQVAPFGASDMAVQLEGEEGGAVEMMWTPEFFWRVFETTGSIWAYLVYRQLMARSSRAVPPNWVVPNLN